MAPNSRTESSTTSEVKQPVEATPSNPKQALTARSQPQHETLTKQPQHQQPEESDAPRRRKRDVLKQVSMRLILKAQHVAEDLLQSGAKYSQRIEDTESACMSKDSLLEYQIPASRKTRKHLWQPKTRDDSVLILGKGAVSLEELAKNDKRDVQEFFGSRVTDPTSYFYRFRYDDAARHLMPQKAEVQLVDIQWLKPHEQVVSWDRVHGLKKATLSWNAYTEPLLVDIKTGTILDGHHRYNVGLQLCLKQLPAVCVDYLGDPTITVDVWPGCGRTSLTKQEVIEMAMSPNVFPPKTSRHRFTETLAPVSIPLSVLRQPPSPLVVDPAEDDESSSTAPRQQQMTLKTPEGGRLRRKSSLRQVSINLLFGAHDLAFSVAKTLFRSRLRAIEQVFSSKPMLLQEQPATTSTPQKSADGTSKLDVIKRRSPASPNSSDFFDAIRANDPTSSFCAQRAKTLEDLLANDAIARKKFFMTRICDPTSYFFKYHFDAQRQRNPQKVQLHLANLKWLKCHEHVVSWERVEKLRRATLRWNAYVEPLLVDRTTGAILDGHHRYHVGLHLQLASVPVVLVDYLEDDSITVDVWPNCGRDELTKEQVIEMALSDDLFPPKTSRHTFSDDLPPISISLARLREPLEEQQNYVDAQQLFVPVN